MKYPAPARRNHLIALAAAGLLAPAVTIAAEQAAQKFDIQSQALSSALTRFSAVTGLQVLYEGDIAEHITAPELKGSYSPEQALQKLLRGSGLNFRFSNGNTVTVEKMAVVEPQSATTTLPTVTVAGKASGDATDPYTRDYTTYKTTTATKTDTPIFDTPVSIQVVPKAVMDDQKSSRIKDALENVSGVRAQSSIGFGTGFIMRGFRTDRIYRNGLVATPRSFYSEFDAANLESIEVLKGPAAVLFGRSEPGGLINATTKKPLDVPYYSLEQQFGSYDHYRTQWDATGPVTDDKSLLYRFTGSYQNNNSFRDFVFNDRIMVSPTVTWRPSDATDLTLNVEGVEQEYQADFGIPVVGKRPAPIPISRSFGDPNDPIDHLSKVHLGTEFNHRFNDDWAIHNRFLATRQHTDQVFINPAANFGDALQADNRTLVRNIFSQEDETEAYTTNLDLTGHFQLWQTKHETLVGFDFMRAYTGYHTQGDYQTPNPALNIDIYNPSPSYGIRQSLIDATLASYPPNPGRNYSMFEDQWYGAYFQDRITLWDKLHILGGGRYDWAEIGRGSGASWTAANDALEHSSPTRIRKDEGFSPRVGILYQPWTWLGIYGNWTTSFGANNGITASGSSIAPETGEQFEAGVKTQLFDDRLLTTLAYYHLTKNNIMTADLSTADQFDNIAIGQARSQGIELDATGRINQGLSLIGNYAYTDARITKNNDGVVGSRLNNVPEHSGSVWLKYDFNGYQAANGFSVGLGSVVAGKREGDYYNSFQLPGYVRVDAFAAYKWQIDKTRVTAQFNIRNLLDKRYYESTDPDSNVAARNGVYPGAPLMAIGSLKVEY
ncbi:MAG: TonB-dependent receptor [Methylococcaceae bacterium]|nr:TonB-dependent receptor [Methylococcaceae bacterium]